MKLLHLLFLPFFLHSASAMETSSNLSKGLLDPTLVLKFEHCLPYQTGSSPDSSEEDLPTDLKQRLQSKKNDVQLRLNEFKSQDSPVQFFPSQWITLEPEEKPEYYVITNGYVCIERIDAFPSSICSLTELTYLRMDGHGLKALPPHFSLLTNLHLLWLHDNKLKRLPKNFGALKSLQYLCLSDNYLIELPKSFKKLTKLKELYLENNRLKEFPKNFSNLTRLKYLNINGNPWDSDRFHVYPHDHELSEQAIYQQGGIKLNPERALYPEEIERLLQNCYNNEAD